MPIEGGFYETGNCKVSAYGVMCDDFVFAFKNVLDMSKMADGRVKVTLISVPDEPYVFEASAGKDIMQTYFESLERI